MRIFLSFFISIAVICAVLIPCTPSARAENGEAFEVRAQTAVLYEKNSGQFLYEKDADEPVHPGSLNRVMTLLLAAEAIGRGEMRLHQSVTVSNDVLEYLGDNPDYYAPGEVLRFSDLLYTAFLWTEGAEACYIIADAVGGSVSEFVKLMNARAKSLGCTGTVFADPSGQRYLEQYTTARDQVIIFSAAVENALFLSIAQTLSHTTAATEQHPGRTISNASLPMYKDSEYYYPGLIAGKGDSHLPDGGYSFVSAMQSGSMKLFAAVIGAAGVERPGQSLLIESYTETARLYDWAQQSFSWRNVTMEHRIVATMPVDYGLDRDKVDLSPAETVRLLLPNSISDRDIKYTVTLSGRGENNTITAPVSRGDVLGAMTVRIPGREEFKVPLVAEQSVRMDRKAFFRDELRRAVTNKWVLLGFALLAVIVGTYTYIVVMYNRTQHENEMRRRETLRMMYEERRKEETTRLPSPSSLKARQEAGSGAAPPDKAQKTPPAPRPADAAPPEKPPKAPAAATKTAPPPLVLKMPSAEKPAAPDKAQEAQSAAPKPAAPDGAPPIVLKMPPAASPKQDSGRGLPDDAMALTEDDVMRLAKRKEDLLADIDALIESDWAEF